jgi:hypothetical protein
LEPAPAERNVRGSLVSGFSRVDIELLDVFEGDVSPPLIGLCIGIQFFRQDYERQLVTVVPLAVQQPLSVTADDDGVVFDSVTYPSKEQIPELGTTAYVYVWNKPPLETLDPEIWSYQAFLEDNLHNWVGEASKLSYLDVDNRREAIGRLTAERPTLPVITGSSGISLQLGNTNPASDSNQVEYIFGHAMRKHFCFDEGYVNLNHGMSTSKAF